MKIAILGSGGREHAIAYAISKSKKIEKIFCLPGNAGTEIIAENINIWTSFSSSFETPTLSELSSNPTGKEGLNLDLDPSKATNFELGWKGTWGKTSIEANVFFIESSNEILPYEIEAFPGRSFYENTGETERKGIELFSRFSWRSFNLEGSFTYAKYSFMNNSYNDLPGIPRSHWSIKVENDLKNGWVSRLIYENVGGFYANNLNTVFINSFQKTRFQICLLYTSDAADE